LIEHENEVKKTLIKFQTGYYQMLPILDRMSRKIIARFDLEMDFVVREREGLGKTGA
jgi:hypothetical protein